MLQLFSWKSYHKQPNSSVACSLRYTLTPLDPCNVSFSSPTAPEPLTRAPEYWRLIDASVWSAKFNSTFIQPSTRINLHQRPRRTFADPHVYRTFTGQGRHLIHSRTCSSTPRLRFIKFGLPHLFTSINQSIGQSVNRVIEWLSEQFLIGTPGQHRLPVCSTPHERSQKEMCKN